MLMGPVVHRRDQPRQPPPTCRRHSISTSTLRPTLPAMADHAPAHKPLLRAPSAAVITLPMPTPSGPSRKMAAELRRHSFRLAAGTSSALPPKPTAAPTTTAAHSPAKVLCAAQKPVPEPTQHGSSELPILRYESIARDVRVSVGSSWKLPRAERKNVKLTTAGPEPCLTVFCSATSAMFPLHDDTVVEHHLETLKLKSSSSHALRLKVRFATTADAEIWRRLVADALAQAAWRRTHEDVACLAQTPVSRVLVARHTATGAETVVKTLVGSRLDDDALTELSVLRRLVPLAHAHAPLAYLRGYRVVETARDVDIVMPRHAGTTLLARLTASGPTRSMRERDARRVVEQLAETLRVVHAHGLVHCDLKLENVLVADNGDVCLIDFGGAFDSRAQRQPPARMVGTPGYIAPERVLRVDDAPTPAADAFSLGILLFQMLVGQHPFAKAQAARRRLTLEDSLALDRPHMERRLRERNVSPEAQQLVAQLTVADPRERITLDQVLNHAWFSNQSAL